MRRCIEVYFLITLEVLVITPPINSTKIDHNRQRIKITTFRSLQIGNRLHVK